MMVKLRDKLAPRSVISHEVKFRPKYDRNEHQGVLKNLSLSGAFLQHEVSLKKDDRIRIDFKFENRNRQLEAKVIWSNEFGCGIQFHYRLKKDTLLVKNMLEHFKLQESSYQQNFEEILKEVA